MCGSPPPAQSLAANILLFYADLGDQVCCLKYKTSCARAWALTRLPILGCGLVKHLNVDIFEINVEKNNVFSNITFETVVKPLLSLAA